MASKFHKGEHVTYALNKVGKGYRVSAIVRHVHRDGTVTVESRFCVDTKRNRVGGYLGYRYTFPATLLQAA